MNPVWRTRGTEYREGRTRAKGDPRASGVAKGLCVLRTLPNPERPGYWLNGHIGTGEVNEEQRFAFTYGVAEARIRFHSYHGSHAAFWLQTTEGYVDGQAEIDVAEYFGAHDPTRTRGTTLFDNVYWHQPGEDDRTIERARLEVSSLDHNRWDTWHVYRVRWTPSRYVFEVDGRQVGTIREGLSGRPKFLVLSMLTSDYEEADMHHGHPLPAMAVDYVRVWNLA